MKPSIRSPRTVRSVLFVCGIVALFVSLLPFRNSSASFEKAEPTANTLQLGSVQLLDPVAPHFAVAPLMLLQSPCTPPGGLIISEFRFRGAAGPNDEFIELYNATDAPITVCTADGSAGWAVAARNAAATSANTLFVIPNGTVIPARGHYLGVNNSVNGYSLGSYPSGVGTTATGDITYPIGVDDNAGVALFNTANSASFSTSTRFDAIGFSGPTGAIADLYREGVGYPPIGTTNGQYTFIRRLAGGFPVDANDNASDIWFLSTTAGTFGGTVGSSLGAPGPENLGSPVIRNSVVPMVFLDSTVATSVAPNRVRDTTSDPANNSTFGTMAMRRRIVNNSGVPVTRLRFHVTNLTTYPPPNTGTADLRVRSSGGATVTNVNDPATCAATGTPSTPPCTVTVHGTTVEEPPAQAMGGGFNSTISVALSQPLAAGASINVQFLVGIQQNGGFSFLMNCMGLLANTPPAAPTNLSAAAISQSQINLAWTDNSTDETGFKIERKTGPGGTYAEIATTGANVTSYGNTGLSSNTQYYYRVRAANGSGNSAYSAEANATTSNFAPSVSLTAPTNNQVFSAPANVTLTATASDSDGTISKVQFFQGATLLNEDTSAPFSFNWTNVAAGSYSLTARAIDNSGAMTTSAPVSIVVNALPTVSITSPTHPTTLAAPATFTINASASDPDGSIIKVEFFAGAGLLGEDTTAPFSLALNNMSRGVYSLTARATDNRGATTTSSLVSVVVNGLPSVNISGPVNGIVRVAPANFIISAFASDPEGQINKVEFFSGAQLIGTDNFAPYEAAWNNVGSGSYTLTAKVTDNVGGTATSAPVNVHVTNPPTTSITSPANNSAFIAGSNIVINANASDSDGSIAKVQFFNGSTLLGEDTTSPYSFTWTNVSVGNYSLTVRATDNLGITATSAPVNISVAVASGISRLDPMNRTGGGGENPLSRNYNWSASLLNLPGRTGLDLGLALSYNSLVWTRSGNFVTFDDDAGFPSPGFRLGFPVIQGQFFNSEANKNAFLLITPDGSRVELRQVGTSALYESVDSSHMLLDVNTMKLRSTDGIEFSYVAYGNDFQCTKIKDRNGNFITINYLGNGRIDTVVDTLGRTIKFNYNVSDGTLASITQTWAGQTHVWASFTYTSTAVQTGFVNVTSLGPANGSFVKTLRSVTLNDNARIEFDYTSWIQVWKISSFAADGHLLNYRSYNLPGNGGTQLDDCPRFTERRDWAENFNRSSSVTGATGLPAGPEQEVLTASFTVPASGSWTLPDGTNESGLVTQITRADGTFDKFYFAGTAGTANGWRRGFISMIETYAKTTPDQPTAIKQRTGVTTWTQDNESVSFLLNPRVRETHIYDFNSAGQVQNHVRTRTTYVTRSIGDGTSCSLVEDFFEYQANASTVLRRTRTDYMPLTSDYTSRRLIGLVSEKKMYEVNPVSGAETLMSRVGFFYDEAGSILGNDAPVQHDPVYNQNLVAGRGNITTSRRYDVSGSQFISSRIRYNIAGSTVSTIDPVGHQANISYADSFSDGNNSRNTLAYPTTASDADGMSSTTQYNFDFGGVTRTQKPPAANQPTGEIKHFTYDSVSRLQMVSFEVGGNTDYSHTRYEYPISQNRVDTYATIQDGQGEAHSFRIMDGRGREIASASDLPGSNGGFTGQLIHYDILGRPIRTSNPTETSASGIPAQWAATGDDAPSGWIYAQQTYDWNNRPLVTTNPSITGNPNDTTTTEMSYSGCGCAGGDVVTITDEGTLNSGATKRRQQKVYHDVLGRVTKTEVLNWDGSGPNGTNGSVYSTTINTYNARDQITRSRQMKGQGPSDPNDLTCQNNSLRLGTDSTWKQTRTFASGWEQAGFDDSSWQQSVTEGAHGTAPWGVSSFPTDTPAHWVWYYDSRNAWDNSTVYFRKSFVATSESATLAIRADDNFIAYLNGVQVATGNAWQVTQHTTLSLTPGATYVLAVVVNNTGGPGGMIADVASVGTMCEQSLMTYDGYGRLKTRHIPGQDPNSVTTYNYNDDDSIISAVDARGATQTLSYNNRHLLTGISYSVPQGSNIPVPSAVTMGYDAAGNRISMSDGLGSVTYQFDQLSRMTSETRNFADQTSPFLHGSFMLRYAYNRGGQLKKITDHTNTTINYNYDRIGRISGVTGEDALYAGVSQYVTAATYRAWGGLKGLTYGNNYTVALSYNARLQETEFEVAGRPAQFGASTVMKTQFSYYADGSLRYARNVLDERFDRAYSYDHANMLQEAFSGSEARDFVNGTTSAVPTGPYRQTYEHNVFGHVTRRDNRFWSQTDTFNASFANNRRQDPVFRYDAQGNLLQDRDVVYVYDAAGRNTSLASAGRLIAPAYDGDGQPVKRVETQGSTTTVSYVLRSSLMGGRIIAELNQSGIKQKGYVFAGGQLLATQENNTVKWRHETPLTGSSGISGADAFFNPEAEPDPTGVNVGFEDPFINCCILPEPPDQMMPVLLGGFESSGRCTLDGISIDCGWAMQMLDSGAAVQCPNNDCGPRTVTVGITYQSGRQESFSGLTRPFQAFADGRSGFGLGGMLLPDGFNIRFTGAAAQAAAGAFFSGMANGNFGAAVTSSINAGLIAQALANAAEQTQKAGDKNKKDKKVTAAELMKLIQKNLVNCVKDHLGFDLSLGSFIASTTLIPGSVTVTGPDYLTSGGRDRTFFVMNDNRSLSVDKISTIVGQVALGLTSSTNSHGVNRTPFVNYTANDLVATGWVKQANIAAYLLSTQIHELGNSLARIAGWGDRTGTVAESQPARNGDTDAGVLLENCVFGGHVTRFGTLEKP